MLIHQGSHAHVHQGNQARERPGQAADQQYTLIKSRGKRVNAMAKYMYSGLKTWLNVSKCH
jgi:hypothetical protein